MFDFELAFGILNIYSIGNDTFTEWSPSLLQYFIPLCASTGFVIHHDDI